MDDVVMTVDEVAEFLRLSTSSVKSYTKQGRIPSHHIVGSVRYLRSEVLESIRNA